MVKQIEALKKRRVLLLEGINDLTAEQLNYIPAGFNNNIIWNLGHMIAVQQGICYKRAGLQALINDDFRERYISGSRPEGFVGVAEITDTKQLFFTTIGQLESDYNNQIFGNYTPWSTRLGGEVANIDEGIKFLAFHEGLHSKIIMDIRRSVTK